MISIYSCFVRVHAEACVTELAKIKIIYESQAIGL